MSKILDRNSNNISISNFYEDHAAKKYNMEPAYQRRSIWSTEKKSFFIDSILKNLPIPPIFLRVKLNEETGRTSYEVIDGKQRLTSILGYIENEFPCSSDQDDNIADENLAGKYFSELSSADLVGYKKQFWTYALPIEYIDVDDNKVIDSIFDRLNRNGEPLNGQELRHSQYYDSPLLQLSYELLKNPFWNARLEITDRSRMEDVEFISELVLTIIQTGEFTSTSTVLDSLYATYARKDDVNWDEIKIKFLNATSFMTELDIDFVGNKVTGVSHLYGIWCFSLFCVEKQIEPKSVRLKIVDFLVSAKDKDTQDPAAKDYKISMSSRTKDKGNRTRRKNALLRFCGLANIT
jgi:Protein of unknown function DUF262